jgi:hypothetical protein
VSEEAFEAQSLDGCPLEQSPDKTLQFGADDDFSWESDYILGSFYLPEEFDVISSPEWRAPSGHLIQDGAHRPKVSLCVVFFIPENLRCHVERRTAQGFGKRR